MVYFSLEYAERRKMQSVCKWVEERCRKEQESRCGNCGKPSQDNDLCFECEVKEKDGELK